MFNWLNNFQLEKISFFLGFLSASILWFVISKFKIWIPDIKSYIQKLIKNLKSQHTSGIQNAIKNEAYLRAQSNHLAKSLFSLDEIIIEPMLLTQPKTNQEDENVYFESEIASTVPFTPDFPLLSRNFNVPRITITDAGQKNADLVICGMPGSGKTVALAYLVSCLTRNDPKCGLLSSKIPLYINVHDTDVLLQPQQSIFDMLYKALSPKLPTTVLPRLVKFFQEYIEENKAILIIDALDELPTTEFDKFVEFLKKIKLIYPNLQMIISSSPFYLGELLTLNFSPLFLSAWSNQQIINFYSNWNRLWKQEISKNNQSDNITTSNSLILNWASSNLRPLTPLEYTLHIWGALAGDLCGPNVLDLYQTYSKRIVPTKEAYDIAISLAADLIMNKSCYINSFDLKGDSLNKVIQSELIQPTSNGKFTFIHSELIGYFASLSQNKEPISVLNQIDLQWSANYAYLGFCAAQDSNSEWLTTYISKEISEFPINFLSISPWLKITNKNLIWRVNYIKQLVKIIQDINANFAVRIRAVAGLVHSNDNSLPVFFRQLLSHNDNSLKELAIYAISCSNRDNSFIADLISLSQKMPSKMQKIICLALSTFEEETAIHELARILLNAEEKVRQLVAECLAFNPSNGTEILQEAVTMDDIVVRRSAINGLVKLNNLWAIQTLKNLMIQDSQWVVRNSATQALEYLEAENPCIPDRKLPLSETPWLIEFAGNQNLGVSIDQSVAPILLLALESQNKKDIYKALMYSTQDANQETITKMIDIATKSPDQALVNQIFLTLYLLRNLKISREINF